MMWWKKVVRTEFKLRFQLGRSKFHFPGIISRGDYFSRLRCAILLFHFQPLITSKLSAMDKPMSPTSLGKFECNWLKGHGGSWKGSASWHWNLWNPDKIFQWRGRRAEARIMCHIKKPLSIPFVLPSKGTFPPLSLTYLPCSVFNNQKWKSYRKSNKKKKGEI